MGQTKSELTVITRTKDLCAYVMQVTQKSPKHTRYTFVNRLQNLCLDALTELVRANDVYVRQGDAGTLRERRQHQQTAMTSLKLLDYVAEMAAEQGCILPRQYEQIARQSTECRALLGGWMKAKYQLSGSGGTDGPVVAPVPRQ